MNLRTIFSLCLISSYLVLIQSDSCPSIDTQLTEELDITKYEGEWYLIKSYARYGLGGNVDCIREEYKHDVDNNEISFKRSGRTSDEDELSISGIADLDKVKAVFAIDINNEIEAQNESFSVISTDYDTYSLVYSCFDSNLYGRIEYASIWSRREELGEEIISNLTAILEDQKSNVELFVDSKCSASALIISFILNAVVLWNLYIFQN